MFLNFKKKICAVVEPQFILVSQTFMLQGENGSFQP